MRGWDVTSAGSCMSLLHIDYWFHQFDAAVSVVHLPCNHYFYLVILSDWYFSMFSDGSFDRQKCSACFLQHFSIRILPLVTFWFRRQVTLHTHSETFVYLSFGRLLDIALSGIISKRSFMKKTRRIQSAWKTQRWCWRRKRVPYLTFGIPSIPTVKYIKVQLRISLTEYSWHLSPE